MKLGVHVLLAAVAVVAVASLCPAPAAAQAAPTGTPTEMVATYNSLADGILALKKTEDNLVRSILAATLAHGQGALARAQRAIARRATPRPPPRRSRRSPPTRRSSGPRATTPSARCASGCSRAATTTTPPARRRGIYEEGYVVVTRKAKTQLLESSRAIAGMAAAPKADALAAEWKKVEGVVDELMKAK